MAAISLEGSHCTEVELYLYARTVHSTFFGFIQSVSHYSHTSHVAVLQLHELAWRANGDINEPMHGCHSRVRGATLRWQAGVRKVSSLTRLHMGYLAVACISASIQWHSFFFFVGNEHLLRSLARTCAPHHTCNRAGAEQDDGRHASAPR